MDGSKVTFGIWTICSLQQRAGFAGFRIRRSLWVP